MNNEDSKILSFLIAVSAHFVLLVFLSAVGYGISLLEPTVRHQEDKIEVGQQEKISPAPDSGDVEDKSKQQELPEIKDELWDELLEDPKPSQNELVNPNAPKPPQDVTNNPTRGLSLDAASNQNKYRNPNPGGIFGNVSGANGNGTEKLLYGRPVDGRTLFVFDASSSMQDFIDSLKEETIKVIKTLTESDEFDCMTFNTDLKENFARGVLFGELRKATEGNKKLAIEWVNNIVPMGLTPTYKALQYACSEYPINLNRMFLVTDGHPSRGWPTNENHTRNIIPKSKEWWKRFKRCKLTCISIKSGGISFVKELAQAVGGSYIEVN